MARRSRIEKSSTCSKAADSSPFSYSGWAYGSGWRSTASTEEETAMTVPIPRARMSTDTAVKPGASRRVRGARRRSKIIE